MIKKLTLVSIFSLLLFFSCKKDDKPNSSIDPSTLKVNEFIAGTMTFAYYWSSKIPLIDYTKETDSKEFFKKLLVPEDLYSFISDDAKSVLDSFDGEEKNFGYSLLFAKMENNSIAAIVEYVYPNSAASKAGMLRGDIILLLEGNQIKESNYERLINDDKITITFKRSVNGTTITESVTLISTPFSVNPAHTAKIFEKGDRKIGYLFYTSFIGAKNNELNNKFAEFKAQGVNEFILDLRYNLGGDDIAINNLCSHLAPQTNVNAKDLLFKTEYNPQFSAVMEQKGENPNHYFIQGTTSLDLKRIYILTSKSTFSASEVTILSLKPYLNVYTIGDKTGGKYTGMSILQPSDATIKNWLIAPITCVWRNKNGDTAKGGIAPNYEANCYFLPFEELGSEQDPLIAEALARITGMRLQKTKAADQSIQPFDRMASKYDHIKSNLILK